MKTGTFRFDVGNLACLAILDGTFGYPPGLFFANLPREQYETHFDAHGQQKETIEVPTFAFTLRRARNAFSWILALAPSGLDRMKI